MCVPDVLTGTKTKNKGITVDYLCFVDTDIHINHKEKRMGVYIVPDQALQDMACYFCRNIVLSGESVIWIVDQDFGIPDQVMCVQCDNKKCRWHSFEDAIHLCYTRDDNECLMKNGCFKCCRVCGGLGRNG